MNKLAKSAWIMARYCFYIDVNKFMWFFRYYSDVGACAKCYLSCMTCSGPRRDQCVSCPRGWQLAAGECHPECPQGFFMSEFGCQKCHHYCKTCKGKTKLYVCSQNFSLCPRPTSDKSSPVADLTVWQVRLGLH